MEYLERFQGLLPDSQGQNLAVTVLHVPSTPDSGQHYLTLSVLEFVLQTSIPIEIRQLIILLVKVKDKLTDLLGG